jgi:hypothetical protein
LLGDTRKGGGYKWSFPWATCTTGGNIYVFYWDCLWVLSTSLRSLKERVAHWKHFTTLIFYTLTWNHIIVS